MPETLTALSAIATDPEFRAKVGSQVLMITSSLEMQTRAYNDGGWDGAVTASDPRSIHEVQSNGRIRITGTRDGFEIRVIVEPPSKGGRVVTAHPIY